MPDERLSSLRDAPGRSRVPRVVHPWPEGEPELVARGLRLGLVLSVGAWTLAALAVLLALAVLA
jgi:hypothetical protein